MKFKIWAKTQLTWTKKTNLSHFYCLK